MKHAACTLLVMLLVGRAATAAEPTTAPEPVRLLFAGSSSTYWNDMPAEIARVVSDRVAGFPDRPATATRPMFPPRRSRPRPRCPTAAA